MTNQKSLQFGKGCYVPKAVAVCPECGGELIARSMAWDTESGRPHKEALEIDCLYANPNPTHRYLQHDWQRVDDAVAKFGNAVSCFTGEEAWPIKAAPSKNFNPRKELNMSESVRQEISERIDRIEHELLPTWLSLGYRLHGPQSLKRADALLQKRVMTGNSLMFWLNVWIYIFDGSRGEDERRVGLMAEASFECDGGQTFDVTLHKADAPQNVEAFFCQIYHRMGCQPVED
jgi:hypothetical protein